MYFRAVLSIVLALTLCAQSPAPVTHPPSPQSQPPIIRTQVNEVIVPVTVTDEKGKFVTDLDKEDFRIFDEGKEQRIQFFYARAQPASGGWVPDRLEQRQPPALEKTIRTRPSSWCRI